LNLSSDDTIVVVHGLWLTGIEYTGLRHRLHTLLDLDCRQFSYSSTRQRFESNASDLAEFVGRIGKGRVHLVGHSLGGMLALAMLDGYSPDNVGRVVCFGAPLNGSAVARRVCDWQVGRRLLGDATEALVVPTIQAVPDGYEVGMVAGSRGAGIGRLVTRLETPHDGTVSVSETRVPGLKDHITLDVGHTGMLVSRSVAVRIAEFIRNGEFA
jgi:pimeloyl-ACP methyl ester carboxylesterase